VAELQQQIRRTIPFYDDALELLVAVVARTDTTPHRILDLGVGTGNLAGLLLGAFPDAHLTGIDILPDFLEIAQHRLARFRDRVQLIEADIAGYDFPAGVDIVVTSFVLHHTEDVTKGRTYERIYSSLNSAGSMANADFVDSPRLRRSHASSMSYASATCDSAESLRSESTSSTHPAPGWSDWPTRHHTRCATSRCCWSGA
jgi:trans-aconitate methyltransferase